MASAATWTVLNDRVAKLDAQIYGGEHSSAAERELVTKLLTANDILIKKAKEVEAVREVWKQIRELEKLTSVSATIETETSAMSDDAKLQIVMAGSSRFEAQAASLKELKATKEYTNSPELTAIASGERTTALLPLASISVEQQNEYRQLSDRATGLIEAYNNITSALSRKFLYWDQLLTAAEAKIDGATTDID